MQYLKPSSREVVITALTSQLAARSAIGSNDTRQHNLPGKARRRHLGTPRSLRSQIPFCAPYYSGKRQVYDYWRSKLAKNKTVDFPPKLSEAIADITEGFSFAYLKETFITSLLMIVGLHKETSKEIDGLPEPGEDASELGQLLLWRVMSKQFQTLRAEMEDARKSAGDAAKNNCAM